MPSYFMDQMHQSSLLLPSASSSFFSEEICFPSERQLGLRKIEPMPDHSGLLGKSLMPGSQSVLSSPLEKIRLVGGNHMNFLELPHTFLSKQQEANISAGNHFLGAESAHNLSFTSSGIPDQKMLPQSTLCMHPAANGFHYENSIFSSSLTEAFSKKLRLLQNDAHFGKSLDATNSKFSDDEPLESMKEIEAQTIGDLLPNDDELLSGVIDIACIAQQNSGDEDDLFCSVGGMEMESDESLNSKGASNCHIDGLGTAAAAANLIYDEHPSRALIVRNVNGNIEDSDLRILFEQFGDINAFYSGKKHSGFIIVSYNDIRAAMNAKRALQDRSLRQQKLDIQYYVPETIKYQDNAPEKDSNNATLIVFNLESVVSKDDLHRIFGSYGEIKEIFHDPCYKNQRAIEFYDVRAAEAALCALNMSIIAGKRIKIELGCSGAGWQWSSGKHSSFELEQENPIICRKSSSPKHSSSVSSGLVTYGANTFGGIDNGPMHSSLPQNLISPLMENEFPGISSAMNRNISSPIKVTMVGNHGSQSSHELSNSLGQISLGFQSMPTIHPHSLPEFHDGLISRIPFNSLSTIPPMHRNMGSRIADEFDNQQVHSVGASSINCHSFEHKEGNGSCPVNGHHYIFNNSNANFHQPRGSLVWQNLPSFINNLPTPPPPQSHGLPRGPSGMMNTFVPLHHVGSAPALKPSLWERSNTYAGDCVEAPFFHPGSLGNMGFSASSPMHSLGITSHNMYPHSGVNYIDPSVSQAHVGSPSPQQRSHMFHGRSSTTSALASYDAPGERIRSRRSDTSANQSDNKKQFELDIDRIIRGEDPRTTLMIKNIPNKYTSKMLLATIDEHHRGTYDFIYLPIDFKNKCNVGYAFINLTDPKHIIPFYQAFNGKKWEKFNSEKVASLAYARIQGKAALIGHFQNSSLMNEDKRCRPIIFHSDGPNMGDQEPFPIGSHIRSRPGRSRTSNNEEHNHRSPSDSDFGNGEDRSNIAEPLSSPAESLSSPTKDSE